MSLGKTKSVVLVGMQGHLIEVEADISQSIPSFVLLGLPDTGLRESQDRIKSAAKNTGLDLPRRRLTVNLYPASLPKTGSGLDLAILMSVWAADGHVQDSEQVVFLAELGLNGRLRPVQGVLPVVAAAAAAEVRTVVVAEENAAEAALVPQMRVYGAAWAAEVVALFRAAGRSVPPVRELHPVSPSPDDAGDQPANSQVDLGDVRGQYQARFGLEVAAAGGHHVLFSGVPGSGKTMLAQRLPGILPRLGDEAAMEVTAIASITEAAHHMKSLRRERPFEAPHHSATVAAIIGGGARLPAPGAVSRAHYGVLFLDEAPEFPRNVLEALRQPLETGTVSLHRVAARVKYPAMFQLALAANPCPCG